MRNASPRGFFMASFLINGFLIYYGWIVGESAGGYGFRRPNSGVCRPELRRSSLPAKAILVMRCIVAGKTVADRRFYKPVNASAGLTRACLQNFLKTKLLGARYWRILDPEYYTAPRSQLNLKGQWRGWYFARWRNPDGDLRVAYLYCNGKRWNLNWNWLEGDFSTNDRLLRPRNSLRSSLAHSPREVLFTARFISKNMIASLSGFLASRSEKSVIVEVGGIGYRVNLTQDGMLKLPDIGRPILFFTHQHVREDALELYGFFHPSELELFEMLISISGIGPRSALSILGVGGLDQLRRAIAAGDVGYLTKVSGVGRKTAEKIVLELREKMAGRGVTVESHPALRDEADALDALISLGYSRDQAREALASVRDDSFTIEKRVSAALKKLGKR